MTSIGGTARPPSTHGTPRRCLPGGRSAWLGAHRGAAALPVSGALRLLRKEPRQPPALPSLPAPPAAGAAAALAPGPERRSLVPAEGAAGRAGTLSDSGSGQCGAAGAVSDSGGGQWGGMGGRAREAAGQAHAGINRGNWGGGGGAGVGIGIAIAAAPPSFRDRAGLRRGHCLGRARGRSP